MTPAETAEEIASRVKTALTQLEKAATALGAAKLELKQLNAAEPTTTAQLEATNALIEAVKDAIHHIEPDAQMERSEGREKEGRACQAQNRWGKALQKARNLK